MNFTPTQEQLVIQEKYRAFAETEMIPVRSLHDREGSFPFKVMDKAWDQGILNGPLPTRYGGAGYTFLDASFASEEMGAGCLGMGITIDSHTLAFLPLLLAGDEDQKGRIFKDILDNRLLGAFCLTEPGAGSDIGALSSRAVRRGDKYILTGRKRFITNGEVAGFHTVFAKTDPEARARGISVFYVPAKLPGVSIISRLDKMGQRASVQNEITYEDVEIPKEHLIGSECTGFRIAMETFNRTRVAIAALSLGNARAAYEYASRWAQGRIQFGKPITAQEGISFKLAEMATELEASRLLVRRAAWGMDQGDPEGGVFSSMAKYYATDAGMRITQEAVQIMGGEGYSRDFPVEKMMRDAKLSQIYEGTNEIQKVIIAKGILRGN
jgi:alkylation response protein AidB-like acyl-CoA dehydrogenase